MRQYALLFLLLLAPCFTLAAPKIGFCSLMLDHKNRRDLGLMMASANKHFPDDFKLHFHIFTQKALPTKADNITFTTFGDIYSIGVCYHEFETLIFLRALLEHKEPLSDYEYLFVAHPSVSFLNDIHKEHLGSSIGALHPHYHITKPFEEDEESTAYQATGDYYSPAFFGGTPEQVFSMCEAIIDLILEDIARDYYVASARLGACLNRYFLDHPPEVFLSEEAVLCKQDYYRMQHRQTPSSQILGL